MSSYFKRSIALVLSLAIIISSFALSSNIALASNRGDGNSFVKPTESEQKTIQNILIMVRFKNDVVDFATEEKIARINELYITGENSLKNYVEKISYDKLTVNTTIYPQNNGEVYSYQDENPIDYYKEKSEVNPIGYEGHEQRLEREQELLNRAANFVKDQVGFTKEQLDINGDGYVDSVSFIVDAISKPEYGVDHMELLWPHKGTLEGSVIGGVSVGDYNMVATSNQYSDIFSSDLSKAGQSVIIHEFVHVLGMPDLYRYSYNGDPVGEFDLMSNSGLAVPQNVTSYYIREYLGFGEPIQQLTENGSGRYKLNVARFQDPAEQSSMIVKVPGKTDEYFVLEYRTKLTEPSLSSEGLLVYRINENADYKFGNMDSQQGESDYIYVFRPNEEGQMGKGDVDFAPLAAQGMQSDAKQLTALGKTIGEVPVDDKTASAGTIFFSDGSNSGITISNIEVSENKEEIYFTVESTRTFEKEATSKEELEELYVLATTKIHQQLYTQESVQPFAEVLPAVKACLDNEAASQADIDTSYQTLKERIDLLEFNQDLVEISGIVEDGTNKVQISVKSTAIPENSVKISVYKKTATNSLLVQSFNTGELPTNTNGKFEVEGNSNMSNALANLKGEFEVVLEPECGNASAPYPVLFEKNKPNYVVENDEYDDVLRIAELKDGAYSLENLSKTVTITLKYDPTTGFEIPAYQTQGEVVAWEFENPEDTATTGYKNIVGTVKSNDEAGYINKDEVKAYSKVLLPAAADLTTLNALIDSVEKHRVAESLYTQATFASFSKAYEQALAVENNQQASEQEVANACLELEQSVKNLKVDLAQNVEVSQNKNAITIANKPQGMSLLANTTVKISAVDTNGNKQELASALLETQGQTKKLELDPANPLVEQILNLGKGISVEVTHPDYDGASSMVIKTNANPNYIKSVVNPNSEDVLVTVKDTFLDEEELDYFIQNNVIVELGFNPDTGLSSESCQKLLTVDKWNFVPETDLSTSGQKQVRALVIGTSDYENLNQVYAYALVDFVETQSLLELIGSLKVYSSEYYQSGYQEYVETFNKVNAVYKDIDSTADQIEQAKTDLQTAYDNLVFVPGDTTKLAQQLKNLEYAMLQEKVYTEDSFNEFVGAFEYATKIVEEKTAGQPAINDAFNRLIEAYNGLVRRPIVVDFKALEEQLASINELDLSGYTKDSVDYLNETVELANRLLEDKSKASQAQVDMMVENLEKAKENLTININTEPLKQLISECELLLAKEDEYTRASFEPFIEAYDGAKELLESESYNQEAVDEAKEKLSKASENLIARGDITAVQTKLEAIDEIEFAIYTDETVEALMIAVENAQKLIEKPLNVTDRAVEETLESLEKAVSNLALKPVETNSLEELVELVAGISSTGQNFTKKTFDEFITALDKAESLIEAGVEDKEQLELAKEQLELAYQNLAKRGDLTSLTAMVAGLSAVEFEKYTNETAKVLQNAIEQANKLIANPENSSATDVAAATEAITLAKNNLELAVTVDELKELLSQAELYANDLTYLYSSLEKLNNAVATAKEVASLENPTSTQIAQAVEELKLATENLVKLPIAVESINQLVSVVEKLDKNLYSSASFETLTAKKDEVLANLAAVPQPDPLVLENYITELNGLIMNLELGVDSSLIITGSSSIPVGLSRVMLGDADGDETIGIADVVVVLKHIVNLPVTTFIPQAASLSNITNDAEIAKQSIAIGDVVILLKHIVKLPTNTQEPIGVPYFYLSWK